VIRGELTVGSDMWPFEGVAGEPERVVGRPYGHSLAACETHDIE
jgi:hypothetical protein